MTNNGRKTLRKFSIELIDIMNLTPEQESELGVVRMSDAVVDSMDKTPVQRKPLCAIMSVRIAQVGGCFTVNLATPDAAVGRSRYGVLNTPMPVEGLRQPQIGNGCRNYTPPA